MLIYASDAEVAQLLLSKAAAADGKSGGTALIRSSSARSTRTVQISHCAWC
jgi:hypothetical protein